MEITLRRPSQSIEIIEFARDMALAQQDMNVAHKGSSNPFFKSKYADWQEVVDASRPALSKNGFSVFLDFEEINQKCYLVCKVFHRSGQWKESIYPFQPPVTNDIQKIASYNTYLKRMLYSNAIGLSIGEVDDDGNGNAPTNIKKEAVAPIEEKSSKEKPIEVVSLVSQDQEDTLEDMLKGHDDIAEAIFKKLKVSAVKDIPRDMYAECVRWIGKQAEIRAGMNK